MLPVDVRDRELGIAPYDLDSPLIEATRADGLRRRRLLRPAATFVVLGRGSSVEREVDLQACEREQVPVLRRAGGGCAVLLDPGNLVLSIVERVPGIGGNDLHFQRITREVVALLDACGVPGVERRGISDLALAERKIGGSAIYRARDLLYYSTTLLLSPDVERMERLLPHPPREPEWRAGRSHRDFVGGIHALVGSCEELAGRFEAAIGPEVPIRP